MLNRFPHWTSTITIYHKMVEDNRVTWMRLQTITGCFWQVRSARERYDGMGYNPESYVVRVPLSRLRVAPSTGDIIVMGACADEIDEYTSGKRSADFLQARPGTSMIIRRIRDDRAPGWPLPHLRYEG